MGWRVDPALLVRRLERAADAGHERRHALSPARRIAPGAHGLRRADRRRQPGDVRQDAVGHLRGLPEARLIIIWGANPSASGIHLVPYIREAQRRGARLVVVDPRTTPLAKQADIHLAVRPGTDLPVALVHPSLPVRGRRTPTRRSSRRTRAAPIGFASARASGRSSAPPPKRASPPTTLRSVAELYATTSPALIRCGWGQERNRNGGSSSLAILALPAVAGKFGVRGGGYAMSNSASWGIDRALDSGAGSRRRASST